LREARVIVTFLAEEQPRALSPKLGGEPCLEKAAPTTVAERLRAFQALVDSLPAAPTLPLEAFDRQNIYP
jgi:hypothetical protein